VPERHHVVTLFWDALLSIGHAQSFPRLGPDYYPCGFQISPPRILNGFDSVFGRAHLQYQCPRRLVVISVATVSSIALFGNPLGYLLVKK
jgi:hypothetical protein